MRRCARTAVRPSILLSGPITITLWTVALLALIGSV
jgi:hypothetical protein